ncbi:MAG: hypothetical protein IV107_06190 [Paucibacter sp.]|nr:hypothetical protein [Roseateles sp.]
MERSANHPVAQGIDNACRIEPGSGAGLSWDAPQIHRTGNLWVSGVPEPRIWALASAGLLDLAWRRHLKHGG